MRPLLVLILLGACATTGAPPLAAAPAPAARSGATHAELLARGEARFAERLDLAQLDAAIAAWREAAALAPDDPVAWARLARALHFRAEGHLVFAVATDRGARDAYRAALDESAGAAERALAALSPELARLRRLGVPLSEAAAVLDARAALPLYWWAQSTLLAAHSRGLGATVGVHAEVFAVMERVAALAPDTWYGGPDRYFGVVFAAAPAIAGGNLGKARAHFDASLKRAPAYLETWVLYAEIWARRAGDDAAWRAALEHVLDAPIDAIPGLEPEQTIAKRKARALLDRARR